MAEIVIMPKLGFNMDTGKLLVWYKNEGDQIRKGEPFFSIETDKTSIDIEATSDGFVRKLLIGEGDTIKVTLPIAIIGGQGENIEDLLGPDGGVASASVQDAEKQQADKEPQHEQQTERIGDCDYDIAVIGSGSGGYVAAIRAAQLGKKVALIERGKLGGTCLNTGCVPTKTLLRSIAALKEVKACKEFCIAGVDESQAELDMASVQERKNSVISQLTNGVAGLLKGNGVTVIVGEAIIKDSSTIEVEGKQITASNIIIATGSVSKSLQVQIDSKMPILTSTEALELRELPESIAIIGAGAIGIEMAYFFAEAGVKVYVIEFLDRILPMVDSEITTQVTKMLENMGIIIHVNAKVTGIKEDAVLFEQDGKAETVKVGSVLMSVGRIPYTEGLDTDGLGIKTDKGAIVTDDALRTSVPNIFAIGDVNGKAMLAHVASMEGIVAVENICGRDAKMDYGKVPSAIYITPEVACVGLTEEQAKEKAGSVTVGRFPLAANGKSKIEGETLGLAKVIIEPVSGEILGAHVYCLHATEIISEIVVSMNLEATAEEIVASIHPHPTVSETVGEVFHAALGKSIHSL